MNSMNIPTRFLFIAMLGLTGIPGCQSDIDSRQGPCTAIFNSITVKVTGDTLTDFYTIRLATSDTIRPKTGLERQTFYYVVLDDTYQPQLANRQETFRFVGKIGTAVVVREDYLIKADHCHIHKVSGKSDIQL